MFNIDYYWKQLVISTNLNLENTIHEVTFVFYLNFEIFDKFCYNNLRRESLKQSLVPEEVRYIVVINFVIFSSE